MAFFSTNIAKHRLNWVDSIILLFIFAILYSILNLGASMQAPFILGDHSEISLEPFMLPYYAGRSLLRMFIAFGASLLFTLIYGYVAAKSQTAEKVLIPLLDMLQSIPVLGFLSATITAFIALFPGSLLGVELASILAIFTGQAWNMTFSFYNSLKTVPKDLQEASDMLGMNWWQRFVKLEVPFSMIGLVWNSMMSFGGGWFFLAASEAISVLGQDIRLPGVGSYLATAIEAGNMQAIAYSIITMIVMILLVDQLFWRPLVVWSKKFKMELTETADTSTSFVYEMLFRSDLINMIGNVLLSPLWGVMNWLLNRIAVLSEKASHKLRSTSQSFYSCKNLIKLLIVVFLLRLMRDPVSEAFALVVSLDSSTILEIIQLGLYTLGRVMIAILLGALWTIPVGVWIGLNPRVAVLLQPIVQIMASFPANMVFPFITILFLRYQVNFEMGSILLMMLGTQWYILFNVIAGSMSIPNDLHEAGAVFNLQGWRKWKILILPSIFPYLITGIITASGGAWNASIVSEIVSWQDNQLIATGLGSYISKVTEQGDWAGIIWGITVMCLFVVLINRFLWRRLYQVAEAKYHLD